MYESSALGEEGKLKMDILTMATIITLKMIMPNSTDKNDERKQFTKCINGPYLHPTMFFASPAW